MRNVSKLTSTILILLVVYCSLALAQNSIAVLPFRSNGLEPAYAETSYRLLRQEILRSGKFELSPEQQIQDAMSGNLCSELSCAMNISASLGVNRVLYGSLNPLGDKIIVQYTLVDGIAQQILISDNITALTVEDLETVMKRIAASVIGGKSVARTAEVGLITDNEALVPNSRKAGMAWGIMFGYLYPQNGYGGKDRVFQLDIRSLYEIDRLAINSVIGIRNGLTFNLGANYYLSMQDVSPYVGAGLGFSLIAHDDEQQFRNENGGTFRSTSTRADGINLNLSSGLTAFRTYNFRVMLNLEYNIVFNDYDDRALMFTIGILRRRK